MRGLVVALLGLFVALTPFVSHGASSSDDLDIVLVIDESGSMARNDPQRSRIRAAQLFVSLLQYGARVGVIRCSTEAETVFPIQTVGDDASRESVRLALDRIDQSGRWTNIGNGMNVALDQISTARGGERYILLFTDGEVDVPGGPGVAAEARRRLRALVVPRCQQSGARLYALAFTPQADTSLLREMAEATNGAFYHSDDPKSLHTLFTQVLARLAKPQEVPIQGDQVLFDSSVAEATFVISRRDNSAPLSIQTPSGQTLRADNQQATPSAHWFQAPEFDVVTIDHPAPGAWTISPRPSGEDRVNVVTDLELVFDPPAGFVPLGQQLTVRAWLSTKKEVLNDPALLSTIAFRAELDTPRGVVEAPMTGEGDGVFAAVLPALADEGDYRLRVMAVGQTLRRLRFVDFSVHRQWVTAGLEQSEGRPGRPIIVNVELKSQPERFRRVEAVASVTLPDKTQKDLAIFSVSPQLYANTFPETQSPGRYAVWVRVDAEDANGTRFETSLGPFDYTAVSTEVAAAATPAPSPRSTPAKPPETQPAASPKPPARSVARSPQVQAPPAVSKPPSMGGLHTRWSWIAAFVAAQLTLGAGGFVLWRRSKSVMADSTLEERLAKIAFKARERLAEKASPSAEERRGPADSNGPTALAHAQPFEAKEEHPPAPAPATLDAERTQIEPGGGEPTNAAPRDGLVAGEGGNGATGKQLDIKPNASEAEERDRAHGSERAPGEEAGQAAQDPPGAEIDLTPQELAAVLRGSGKKG